MFILAYDRGNASPDWGKMGAQRRPPREGDMSRDRNDEIQPLYKDLWEEHSKQREQDSGNLG